MTNLRQRMVEELQRRNYSPSTIRGYIIAVKQFAEYFGKPPDRLGATHVQRFQWYLLQERKLASSTVEIRIAALRFFFKKMLKRRDMHFDDMPFPKVPQKLPTVLSPEEVQRMIDGTTNLMHRTILMVLYATGVRRTELSLLKVADIDSKRMVIRVEQGKGRKDRYVMLSPHLLGLLRAWWRAERPQGWLFPGRDRVLPMTTRQLNRACHAAAQRAEIDKRVSLHTLRHSFATHLLEQNIDVRVIQVLLGHAKLDTTALYTRVATRTISEVMSPLEHIALKLKEIRLPG